MRRRLIAGNWKMNGSFSANKTLLTDINTGIAGQCGHDDQEVLVCVPVPYLSQCADSLSGSLITLGAQDLSTHVSGAYTGEVSAAMLADCGCRYVIVGHSERRAYHHESDEMIAQKALRAVECKLAPIVCVGETLGQRETGRTNDVVIRQLHAVLDELDVAAIFDVVIAYEPVWAIGTGKTATPQSVQEVHQVLRQQLFEKHRELADSVRILYGGGMTQDNAAGLLSLPDVDGGLVGSAALNAKDFLRIIKCT